MPRKKSEKKIKIRVGRAGRVARPRAVGSGKKSAPKQTVNIYVTPSGAVSYSTPIRSSTVTEPPVVIPQQPSVFQPIFPTQTFQQQERVYSPEVPILPVSESKQYSPEVKALIERQRQALLGLEPFQSTDPFAEMERKAKEKQKKETEKQMKKTERQIEERVMRDMYPEMITEQKIPPEPIPRKKMTNSQADYYFGTRSREQIEQAKDEGFIFPKKWKP